MLLYIINIVLVMNICELEKENGNIEFKNGNFKNALHKYLLSLKYCKDVINQRKILFSNLALVNVKLRNYDAALLYCNHGLEIIDDNDKINKKL